VIYCSFRGTVRQAQDRFREPRGEFTLVVGGPLEVPISDAADWRGELCALKEKGVSARDATARVSQASGLPKKELYRIWISI
jgi:16S rRNA (cytidine1402-2'-O)-methyltransferase